MSKQLETVHKKTGLCTRMSKREQYMEYVPLWHADMTALLVAVCGTMPT